MHDCPGRTRRSLVPSWVRGQVSLTETRRSGVRHQPERAERPPECRSTRDTGVSWRARRRTWRSRSLTASSRSTACWKRVAGSLRKTLVVPVATGVRLGVDTVCLLWGASPWERRPARTGRQRKEPRYQGQNTRYQGSFVLIDRHVRRCRVAPLLKVRGIVAIATTGEREASSQLRRKRTATHAIENRRAVRPV